jgi:hypothetical protein
MTDSDSAYTDQQASKQQIKAKFWSLMQDGLSNVMSDAQQAWNGPDGPDYAVEKMLLSKSYRPFMWGMATTCVCFVTFRVTGSAMFRNIRQKLAPRRPQKKVHVEAPPEPNKQWKSYSERMMEERTAALNDVASLPTDAILSIMLGISITGITLSPSERKQEFQIAPLLPGRSLVSQHLCTSMVQLYDGASPKIWDYNSDDKPDETLETLRNFAIHCKKRDQVEDTIRREQGIIDGQSVSIPPPNVNHWYGKESTTTTQ